MIDKRSNENRQEQKTQPTQQVKETSSKEETSNEQSPDNRLKDGTNDFQNGDQEPTSERSSDNGNQPRNS